MQPAELVRLLSIVDPLCTPGRVTLITRYGCDKIASHLPLHIAAVLSSPHRDSVIWQSDPMHGNTRAVQVGGKEIKTRVVADIMSELAQAVRIHRECGTRALGGAHLELTAEGSREGRTVTECVGGSMELSEGELAERFESYCDRECCPRPRIVQKLTGGLCTARLNFEQSLDAAFMLSHEFQAARRGRRADNRILQGLSTPSRPQSAPR